MNKKLVLSVLSTAVLTSMAASAMAKPSQGFYVGGEVDKYYSPTALLADFKAGLKEILSNATDTVYVNKDGKAANFLVAAEAEKMEDVLKPATRDLFEENDYAVVGSEGEKWNPADENDWPVPGDITVESVSAISTKSIKVTFVNAVAALNKEDVTVVNKTTGDKQYVKSVTVSEDKKSAVVEFYESLTKGTYTATVKSGSTSSSKDFDFAVGKVAKIEAETTQIVPAGKATAIKFKILDEAGLDVTADYKDKVTYESNVTIADGKTPALADGAIALVYVKYQENGTEVKSEKITVKAEASKATELVNWTLAAPNQDPGFDKTDYKQNTVAKTGSDQKFFVQFKDQFGEKSAFDGNVRYESLDKTIALVDQVSGSVKPIKNGTVPVKISVLKDGKAYFTKTVEISVVAKADVNKIEFKDLKDNEITLSSSLVTTKNVTLAFKDQYGDDFTYTGDVKVTVKSGKDIVEVSETTPKGTYSVKPVPNTEGVAVVEFAINDQIKTELLVKVEKAGAVADFSVDGFESVLDKSGDGKTSKSEFTLKVYAVDANGGKAQQLNTNVHYSVKDSAGNPVNVTSENGELLIDSKSALFEVGKEYTVTVKVGENAETAYQVFSGKFSVKDTKELPKVTLTKGTLDVSVADSKNDTVKFVDVVQLNQLFDVTYTGAGSSDITVTDFEFVGDNDAVLNGKTATTATLLEDGVVSIVINTVSVKVKEDTFKVDLGEVLKVNVKGFGDKEAAKALEEEVKKINSIPAPEADATKLTLPTVGEGYSVAIKSSDNEDVIAKDGTITPPDAETTVKIVLTVTQKSTGKTADTGEFEVKVPAKTTP
ncbi:immunoglobulin-like domain-containing protein [Brevibacillus sp. FSL K6-6036]|uniref:immunoglobulin-like domain-containing protein n=1 Tax=Brevibacillus sp. FSL K6-6036 TaxID=2954682 RepID=UPI0030D24898